MASPLTGGSHVRCIGARDQLAISWRPPRSHGRTIEHKHRPAGTMLAHSRTHARIQQTHRSADTHLGRTRTNERTHTCIQTISWHLARTYERKHTPITHTHTVQLAPTTHQRTDERTHIHQCCTSPYSPLQPLCNTFQSSKSPPPHAHLFTM